MEKKDRFEHGTEEQICDKVLAPLKNQQKKPNSCDEAALELSDFKFIARHECLDKPVTTVRAGVHSPCLDGKILKQEKCEHESLHQILIQTVGLCYGKGACQRVAV